MFYGIWLIVLGVLGAASLIIAKKPEAKEYIDKLAPYQGWMGAGSAIWGVWGLISAVLNISMLGDFPIWWITWVATSLVTAALGIILGVGVLKTFIKGEGAEKLDQLLEKLQPHQGRLGVAAIGIGIWCLVANLMFS